MQAALLTVALLALGAPDDRQPLPLVGLDGAPVALGPPAATEVIVVHFWATWCPRCAPELPIVERAARACAGSPVRLLAVNVGEGADRVQRYLAENELAALPVLLDPRGRSWRRHGGRELPINLIWTAQRQRVDFGPADEVAWRTRLSDLGCAVPDPAPAGER